MKLEWAVPARNTIQRTYGWDIIGLGMEGIEVDESQVPVDAGVPMMLCWSLDPDDDLGASTVFYYQVHGPDGLAGQDIWEAFHPPFFEEKEGGIERIYHPLEVAFNATKEGPYFVRFGETEDLGVTLQQSYEVSLLVSYKRHDPTLRLGPA